MLNNFIKHIRNSNENQKQKTREKVSKFKKKFDQFKSEFSINSLPNNPISHETVDKPINNSIKTNAASIVIYDPFYDDYTASHQIIRSIEQELSRKSEFFDKKICPYCGMTIEKLSTRSKVCKNCKRTFYIKKNIITKNYMLLTDSEFSRLKQERQKIDFNMYTAELNYRLNRHEFGLYRNAKYNLLKIALEENKMSPYELLIKIFEVCYLDISGPNNVHNMSPNLCQGFTKIDSDLAPGIKDLLEYALEICPHSLDEYEKFFLTEMEKLRLKEQKLLPSTAWKIVKRYIKSLLSES